MSIKIITAVFELPSAAVSWTERLVLLALAWHADANGQNAWPSVQTISRKTSLSERGVRQALTQLKAKGLIAVQSKSARRSVRYAVAADELHRELRAQPSHVTACNAATEPVVTACNAVSEPEPPPVTASGAPLPACNAATTALHATKRHTVHPIRPLTVREPSWEEEPRAARARALPEQTTTTEKSPETSSAGNGHGPRPWTAIGDIEFTQTMATMRSAVRKARRWR